MKVIFYSDTATFGGHEHMAVCVHDAIRSRAFGIDIHWLISNKNERLINRLEQEGLNYSYLISEPSFSFRRNPIRALVKITKNTRTLRRMSADLIVLIQGNITSCYDGALSSRLAHVPFASYIPMVYRSSALKRYRFPFLTNLLWSLLYRSIRNYITIDAEQETRLREENRNACVAVVSNYIPRPLNSSAANMRLVVPFLPSAKKVLAVIGRIEFAHKCQDWVVNQLKNDPFMEDKYIVFVGDGSNARDLVELIAAGCGDRFGIVGWQANLDHLLERVDAILVPSKIEGVPLVMLEALARGIPVVGTDQDGMRSWLPPEWRFPWGDVNRFKDAITAALSGGTDDVWRCLESRLAAIHDKERLGSEFAFILQEMYASLDEYR